MQAEADVVQWAFSVWRREKTKGEGSAMPEMWC
jgi:hypothetical protein